MIRGAYEYERIIVLYELGISLANKEKIIIYMIFESLYVTRYRYR